ncbi:hypothetical protein KY290_012762 [Solanum tuberosum]|uniref:DUF4283 domain-containing protein n=1 Tax=Solanum tuberosum TaxID=4113 RepID=A0ABQ7VL65_SOLTU|nr:hypothetical protein KY285_012633 [Solanum tuberosum]KAH0768781.1 hypothetical protein KY290_012762 [Solanum tuberosum]
MEMYVNILKAPNSVLAPTIGVEPIPLKKVTYTGGIPRVSWTEDEVNRMNTIENLQFAVIGKFSYGWPEIDELQMILPRQCNIKGGCKIGLLRNRHSYKVGSTGRFY